MTEKEKKAKRIEPPAPKPSASPATAVPAPVSAGSDDIEEVKRELLAVTEELANFKANTAEHNQLTRAEFDKKYSGLVDQQNYWAEQFRKFVASNAPDQSKDAQKAIDKIKDGEEASDWLLGFWG